MPFLLVISGSDGSVVGHCLVVKNILSSSSPQPLTTDRLFVLLLIPAITTGEWFAQRPPLRHDQSIAILPWPNTCSRTLSTDKDAY
jgi:hypothetical protein